MWALRLCGQARRVPAQNLASRRRCSSGFPAARLAAAAAECAPTRVDGAVPLWLERELRSNHAGETGAVWIYRGARAALRLRGTGSEAHRQMALVIDDHEHHERQHLEYMERIIPPQKRTVFNPLWVAAGFVLGLLPSLLSPRAFYLTTEGVETFVEQHYGHQIARLRYGAAALRCRGSGASPTPRASQGGGRRGGRPLRCDPGAARALLRGGGSAQGGRGPPRDWPRRRRSGLACRRPLVFCRYGRLQGSSGSSEASLTCR